MPKGNKLSKIKFLSISRDIKNTTNANAFDAKALAKKHGISLSSIYQVRKAKTWPGYVAFKQRGDTPKVASAAKKFEAAQKAGLNPVLANARQVEKHIERETANMEARREQIARQRAFKDLFINRDTYITRGELREEIRAVHSRVDVLSDVLRGLNRDPLFRALFGRKVRGIIAQRDESKEVA